MNIDDIKLKIKEIHNKVNEQEARLINADNPISILDVDMQMMYIRILYDQYMSLQQYVLEMQASESTKSAESETLKSKASPVNALPSLFDSFDEETEKTNSQDVEMEEEPIDTLPQTPEKEEEKVEIAEPEKENTPEEPIEIDIDNIEFVEEDDEEEEEVKPESMDPYKDKYFPQINPMIDDTEPEIAIPITKEGLQKARNVVQTSHSLGDTYAKEKTAFNEQFSGKSENNMANKLQKTQNNDLMKAIDINDKFQFIRELFNGNGSLFTETINQLNQFPKLTDAMDYLEKTRNSNRWKEDCEAYEKLYELILKKFAGQ
ncbi:MAG: hypothetical protein RBS13_01360 [Bacteroidales bacterium]|jgi:hypothetical protein|nr:hypothetical protein [Bacteroidales bacterium]